MHLLFWCLLTVASGPQASVLPLDSIKENPTAPCLDTVKLIAKFQGGELEDVYRDWLGFFERTRRMKLDMDMPCLIQGERMLGVLQIVLMGDTAKAYDLFQNLAVNAPMHQLWDLNLPYEVQAIWDEVREKWGPSLTDQQIWETRWLPPPIFEAGAKPAVYKLRKLYHDNRVLYALGRDQDPEPYVHIMQTLQNQKDPVFILLRSDAMLRLGFGPSQVESELDRFEMADSPIMATYDLVAWRGRLGLLAKRRSAGLEKKKPSQEKNSTTTLQLSNPKKD